MPEAGPSSRVQRRLKPGQIARLVAGYRAGATARELAGQFGIHRDTVTAHLRREGVAIRQRGLRPDQTDEAARLYGHGWSTVRVGKKFGVSNHTISAALRNAGIPIRTRSGQNALDNDGT
jgi:DNA-binding CsgD family transcriptional regulator